MVTLSWVVKAFHPSRISQQIDFQDSERTIRCLNSHMAAKIIAPIKEDTVEAVKMSTAATVCLKTATTETIEDITTATLKIVQPAREAFNQWPWARMSHQITTSKITHRIERFHISLKVDRTICRFPLSRHRREKFRHQHEQ